MRRLIHLFVATALMALASGAFGIPKLTEVSIERSPSGVSLHILGMELPQPKKLSLQGGKLVIFEFPNTLCISQKTQKVNEGNVLWVKNVQYTARPPVARVVISLKAPVSAIAHPSEKGWQVSFGDSPLAVPVVPEKPEIPSPHRSSDQDAMEKAIQLLESSTASKAKNSPSRSPQPQDNKTPSQITNTPKGEEGKASAGSREPKEPKEKVKDTVLATQQNQPKQNQEKPNSQEKTNQEKLPPIGNVVPVAPKSASPSPKRITSLEFDKADVSLIIKALTEQTGANIVTAPTVTGTLTVSLRDVTVEDALDLITKLTNFRYAKIGNTYVVGDAEFLNRILLHETSSRYPTTVTRVVPLASRKAAQIRSATIKALGMDSLNEKLQIVHPSEQEPSTAPPQNQNQQQPPTQPVQPAETQADADYLILIGEPQRVQQAESVIKELDNALAQMYGLVPFYTGDGGSDMTPVRVTYRVRGGKAEDLANAIRPLAGPVSVAATPKTSRAGQTILLEGRPAEVQKVLDILAQIDDVSADGELVYEVYQVKHADPRALKDRLEEVFESLYVAIGPESAASVSYGAQTQAGQQQPTGGLPAGAPAGGGMGQGTRLMDISARPAFSDRETQSKPMMLILRGTRPVVDSALTMLSQIDRKPPQVAIEARVMEITKEEALRAGIDWNILSGGNVQLIRFNNSQPPGADGSPFNQGKFATWGKGGEWTAEITATLDKLSERNRVIARPNVVATDGREAIVFIGDIVRYIKTIQATQNGITVEVGEEEVGVKLNVLPRVGADGTITLEAQPTVSFISGFLQVPGGGSIPQTSVRTARINPTVRDGETFAIGGLIREDDRLQVSGLPVLMDLPIVGQLFRRTTKTKQKTEIVIFLTVKVLKEDSAQEGTPPPPDK